MNFANLRAKKKIAPLMALLISNNESAFEYPFETFSRRGVDYS